MEPVDGVHQIHATPSRHHLNQDIEGWKCLDGCGTSCGLLYIRKEGGWLEGGNGVQEEAACQDLEAFEGGLLHVTICSLWMSLERDIRSLLPSKVWGQ